MSAMGTGLGFRQAKEYKEQAMDEQTATSQALEWYHRFYAPAAPLKISADQQPDGRWHLEIECDSIPEVVRVEVDKEGLVARRLGD